jgi:hypothetical protein
MIMKNTARRLILPIALATTFLGAAPAAAAVLVPGSTGVAPEAFNFSTQGLLLASDTDAGTAFTFSAEFRQAVYQNTLGTLDFYFQVDRTGAGSLRDEEIRSFTVSAFDGFTVDAFVAAGDPDGPGIFTAANNPTLANGTPSGSTTTFGRSPSGNVLTTEFGANGLTGSQDSATYIFRTNATAFNNLGTFGVIDGSTLQGLTYMPVGLVPEPATWAMMLLGFGAIGYSMRRRKVSYRLAQAV